MKLMVRWELHPGAFQETLSMFSRMTPEQDTALMGDGVVLVGRWHDLAGGTGVAIFETDSIEQFHAYALNWNRFMDLEVTPVLDDDEARELGRSLGRAN